MSADRSDRHEEATIHDTGKGDAVMLSLLIALWLSVVSIASSIVYAQAGNVPRAFVPVLSTIAALIAAWLIQRGRPIAGVALSLVALGASLLYLASQFTGIGILGALVFTAAAVALVARSFPRPARYYGLGLVVVAGLFILVVELFWPGEPRNSLPGGTFPVIAVALAIGLFVLVAGLRRYRTFSLQNKIVVASLLLAYVPLIIMLAVALRGETFQAEVTDISRALITSTLLLAACIAVLAWLLADWISDPFRHLQDAASRILAGDLDARVEVESEDEVGHLAATLNAITTQLQETVVSSERRLASRTSALAACIEVGRRLASIRDENQLVSQVVDLLAQSLEYAHVQLYLLKEGIGGDLFLVGASGEVGQILLEEGQRIPWGSGLTGWAADHNEVALVPDVDEDPRWVPNRRLPHTRAEIAVPISLGEVVLGVLDVQDDRVEGLWQQDADLLLSIANQMALALETVRSRAQLRRQSERQARIAEINRTIRMTTDASSAMQIMIRELGRAVQARSTSIWLDVATVDANRSGFWPGEQSSPSVADETEGLV